MAITTFRPRTPVIYQGKKCVIVRKVDVDLWQLEEEATGRLHQLTFADLGRAYCEQSLTFVCSFPGKPLSRPLNNDRFLLALPETEVNRAKVKRSYLLAIEGLPATRKTLEPIIRETWLKLGGKDKPPSFASVCRWRTQSEENHRSLGSLINQLHKCGNRNSRYPAKVIELVVAAIESHYLKNPPKTIDYTRGQAKLAVMRENDLRPPSDKLPIPTLRLVRSEILKIPAFDRYAARRGRMAAVKAFRNVEHHRITDGPLERAEIDHTPLDIIVFDDVRGIPMGRPWLTAIVDDFTRCILGVYISFSAPSYLSVAKCLKHAFVPKVSLKDQFPSLQNDWLPFGIPLEIVVDNGTEFHSESLELILLHLGSEIHYSARKTPWFKGKIERVLGTLNRQVTHGQLGTTFSNIFEKGDYDPKKDAVVRLSTLIEAVNIWIVDEYHQKPHRALNMPPIVAWTSNISQDQIMFPEDPLLLDAIVAKTDTRKLTHKGIECGSLYYNCPTLAQLRRRLGAEVNSVQIRYNPETIDSIIVISPDNQELIEVPAVAIDYARGLNEQQHKFFIRYAAQELKKYDDRGWLMAQEKISKLFEADAEHKKSVMKRAAKAKRDAKNQSTADQLSGIGQDTDVCSFVPEKVVNDTPVIAPPRQQAKTFAPIFVNRSPSAISEESQS